MIETAREVQSRAASTVDKRILDRIQKCLDRAHLANASESEAKAALFVSQKLMSQHNVPYLGSNGAKEEQIRLPLHICEKLA